MAYGVLSFHVEILKKGILRRP